MSLAKCERELKMLLKGYENEREALLCCLHKANEICGYLTEDVILFLAQELNLPPVEVYSVATFYSMFNLQRQGKYVIRVCVSLPCYLRGSKEILEALQNELNITVGQTTADKKFTIEAVSCLGACDKAPVMTINEKLFGNLTAAGVRQIISQYKREEFRLERVKEWRK
jgi:NADH-quinone oxidoreductase E subunit